MWDNSFITKNYVTRTERYEYFDALISNHFPQIKKILNIGGGGKRDLEKFLGDKIKVFEVATFFYKYTDLIPNIFPSTFVSSSNASFSCVCSTVRSGTSCNVSNERSVVFNIC
jgi:hypothetical protein